MVTSNGSSSPILRIVISTEVPFSPLSFFITSSLVILYASSPLMAIILSHDCRPTWSDGLSGTGDITVMYP